MAVGDLGGVPGREIREREWAGCGDGRGKAGDDECWRICQCWRCQCREEVERGGDRIDGGDGPRRRVRDDELERSRASGSDGERVEPMDERNGIGVQDRPAGPIDSSGISERGLRYSHGDRSCLCWSRICQRDAKGQPCDDRIHERDCFWIERRSGDAFSSAVDGGNRMRGDGLDLGHSIVGAAERGFDAFTARVDDCGSELRQHFRGSIDRHAFRVSFHGIC